MLDEVLDETVSIYADEGRHPEDWDMNGLRDSLIRQFSLNITSDNGMVSIDGGKSLDKKDINLELLKEAINEALKKYEKKKSKLGSEMMR